MSRSLGLVVALVALVAAPGCSSCLGGFNSCRRPSFMEFRSPCRGQPEPCAAPACEPACAPAPCCEGGGEVISGPMSAPVVGEQGTFS